MGCLQWHRWQMGATIVGDQDLSKKYKWGIYKMVSDLSFMCITTMEDGKAWAAFESLSFLWDKAIPNFDRAPFFIYTQSSSFRLSKVAEAVKNVPPAFRLINNPRT